MMRLAPLAALALLASCAKDGRSPNTRKTVEAYCAGQADNPLRLDCEATLDSARELTVEWSDGARVHRKVLDPATDHTFGITGLRPDTDYTWTVIDGPRELGDSFTTGSLPDGLPSLTVTGEATAPFVFLASGPWVAVASTEDGAIVWYQGSTPDGDEPQRGTVSGFDWTGDGAVWHITSQLHQVGLDGRPLLFLERGVDYDRPLHHDVFYKDGRIWSLNADVHSTPEGDFVYDGLYAFEDGAVVAEWDLFDHYAEQPLWEGSPQAMWDGVFPGTEDVAHGNAVFEADDGTILVSFRKLSSVWALDGLDSGSFGEVRWRLRGWGGPSDLAISSSPGLTDQPNFQGQHHPELHGDRLTLFDNRSGTDARTVAMDLDPAAGTAEIVEVHRLERLCGIQSANYELANGNVLATCATSIELFEFAAGSAPTADPVWTATVDPGEGPWVARAIPIEAPPAGWASE